MMTIKTSLLVVTFLAVMNAVDMPPIADLAIVFLAGGVIPGTGFAIPPDVILITATLAFMLVFSLVFHLYSKQRAAMRVLVPRYKLKRQDPPYTALVPGLAKALALGRALRQFAENMPRQIYFWLKYLGHPARISAAMSRTTSFVNSNISRLRAMYFERERLQQSASQAMVTLRRWGVRARAYILRVTTF